MSDKSTMPAGRELDRLIAEKVFGWRNLEWHKANHDRRFYSPEGWYGEGPDDKCFLAERYSTDIRDAWQVVEKLREGKLDVMLGTCDGGWHCRIATDAGTPSFWREVADEVEDTAPLAICGAALETLADKESEAR
jgi:hypothetical protein